MSVADPHIAERFESLSSSFERAAAEGDWGRVQQLDLDLRDCLHSDRIAPLVDDAPNRERVISALRSLLAIQHQVLASAEERRQEIADALYRLRADRQSASVYESVRRHSA